MSADTGTSGDSRGAPDAERDAGAGADTTLPSDGSGRGDANDAAFGGDARSDGASTIDARAAAFDAAIDVVLRDVSGGDGGLDGAWGPGDAAPDVPLGMPPCGDAGCAPVGELFAGDDFNCLRSGTGAVACWGANDRGQLGRGTITPLVGGAGGEHTPQVLALPMVSVLGVGASHACVAAGAGPMQQVLCWGDNRDRALGVGASTDTVTTATRVVGFAPSAPITALTLGQRASFAFFGRELFAWGANPDGTLGLPAAPSVVSPPRTIAIALRPSPASALTQGFIALTHPGEPFGGTSASPHASTRAPRGVQLACPKVCVAC